MSLEKFSWAGDVAQVEASSEESPRHWRPQTRRDCENDTGPCPFVGCRYHALIDVVDAGSIAINSGMELVEGGGTRGRKVQASRRLPVWRESPRKNRAKSDDRRCDEVVDILMETEHTCVLRMVADDRAHTLDEVGAVFNVSRERVRQIEESALAKLRTGLAGLGLDDILDAMASGARREGPMQEAQGYASLEAGDVAAMREAKGPDETGSSGVSIRPPHARPSTRDLRRRLRDENEQLRMRLVDMELRQARKAIGDE